MRVMLLDNKDSFTYNIVHILLMAGLEVDVFDNGVNPESIDANAYEALIISPGPGNPLNPEDRGIGMDLLGRDFPAVLGVCFGNQLIGLHMGCEIYRTENLMHGEIDTIENGCTGILSGLPAKFSAVRYHSLAIRPNKNTVVDATSSTDGTVMAFHSTDQRFYGVQFHPESYYSQFGKEIIGNFIEVAHEHGR